MVNNKQGFTLIELMIVIVVIGILAAIAIPNFMTYRNRAYWAEGYSLAGAAREEVMTFYEETGHLPTNNQQAGLAPADLISGKYVAAIQVEAGQVRVIFKADSKLSHSQLLLTPIIAAQNPTGPVSWAVQEVTAEADNHDR